MNEFKRPLPGAIQKTLLNLYESNNTLLAEQNPLKPKSDNVIRMMTWNVHYWSKIVANNDDGATEQSKESANYKAILNDINEIKPDIICMQEVNYGKTAYFNADLNEELNKIGYMLVSYCNTVPSWFVVPYGNAIVVRKDLGWCDNTSCIQVPQRNNVYKNNSAGKSTKCYIEAIYKNIKIICTHLDVYDNTGKIREKQIDELNEYIGSHCPSIIFGDFNLVCEDDYKSNKIDKDWYNYISCDPKLGMNGDAYNFIKSKGWIDVFDIKGTKPKYTTWNITRIDFIFFKNFDKVPNIDLNELLDDCFVHYTTNSDHIPVIIDIKKSELTKVETNSTTSSCNMVKFYPINYTE